ncbi:MAG: YcaQ family DNA glycosylase [Verrucomicrobiaceae bacterium]|nr:YcaQ family DNA glycosylase [Verrucomicrobiaceae bacterium]
MISTRTARRFMRLATGLDTGFATLDEALAHLGFVQIDPINVCGRMQDHILRHRVIGYREHDLMRHLHHQGVRTAFEHHLPDSNNLAALPMEAWPHLQHVMCARVSTDSTWSGKLSAAEKKLAISIIECMRDEGPLCSQDIESSRKAKTHAWDSTSLAKSTLQKLFFHGRVLIARREANRRYYDLPETVLPADILNSPTTTQAETDRWLALLKLRQRRLAVLKSSELRLIADEVLPVTLADQKSPMLHLLRSDEALLDSASNESPRTSPPLLIAPLDPIIYDRRVTEAVWGFDYRWEVYVPPQKRVRGYYALPLLHRDAFIGYADVKADREAGLLQVMNQESSSQTHAKRAVSQLCDFLGLRKYSQ